MSFDEQLRFVNSEVPNPFVSIELKLLSECPFVIRIGVVQERAPRLKDICNLTRGNYGVNTDVKITRQPQCFVRIVDLFTFEEFGGGAGERIRERNEGDIRA